MSTVSIVIPCRNEEARIAACLESLLASLDEPPEGITSCATAGPKSCATCEVVEVLVVDGRSDDGTRAIVGELAAGDARIHLLDNPRTSAAAAMNIGIAAATGDVIVRADAHCLYPPGYVRRLVNALEAHGADNVGAMLRTEAGDGSVRAAAIARALSHRFGVGGALFRTLRTFQTSQTSQTFQIVQTSRTFSTGTTVPREADTVPFGCFRRELFERTGPFREELDKNEDDEFNARVIGIGGRVLLLPDVEVRYFARKTIGELWREYFDYGCYKPLALRLAGRAVTLRQFVPAAWVAALAGFLLWTIAAGHLPVVALVVTGSYLAAAVAIAAREAWARRDARQATRFAWWLVVAFATLHAGYGIGWWLGLPKAGKRLRPCPAEACDAEARHQRKNAPGVGPRRQWKRWENDRGERFVIDGRERALAGLLRDLGLIPLGGRRVLDVGCGTGDGVARFRALGASGPAPVGVDVAADCLAAARTRGDGAFGVVGVFGVFVRGNAARLPFGDQAFDVVSQSTVFSSILNEDLRRQAAAEMVRVLKPGGVILWYDFWWNPTNPATRGIGLARLRRLFPGCDVRARRVTLAPPIARPLARVSWRAAQAVEMIWPLRTHYCAIIRQAGSACGPREESESSSAAARASGGGAPRAVIKAGQVGRAGTHA